MRVLSILLLLSTAPLQADDLCGTSPANDARVRALHERPASRARIAANADALPAVVRDGAFYLGVDEAIAPGHRPFDLAGQSLVFEPRGANFAVRREALRYVEPAGGALRDFREEIAPLAYDLPFAFPIFGRSVTRVYLSAFNGVHLSEPSQPAAPQFDDLEAAVYRDAVISPLMITNRKPSRLHYPSVFVDQTADSVIVTWRSTTGEVFGYDVQAELRRNGSFVFSYRSTRAMRWGAPIVSAGFDPLAAARRELTWVDDSRGDPSNTSIAALRTMSDIRRVEVHRIGESDLLAVRILLAAPVDTTKFAEGQGLRFIAQIGTNTAWLEITRDGWRVFPFTGSRWIENGSSVRIAGDTVEIYGMQLPFDVAQSPQVRVWSYTLPVTQSSDFSQVRVFLALPANRVATDLSAVANGAELALPIAEPFTLGMLDPLAVWDRLQPAYALSDYDFDAVAIYQTFFTDLIFYAGAYATGGNAQVDGIRPASSTASAAPRAPTLLHMNQFTYGWNATTKNAAHVIMHEFGHRWLYFFNIKEGEQLTRSLNPVSAHPAGYVHTPAAFRVHGDEESSVMGGGFFAVQADGTYRVRAANSGYSWTDLYLMGLAAPEEVPPWFYLANTDPPQAKEYWATDGAVVTGELRDVTIDQITAAHGARNPSAAISQKVFRVLFVLVTENGAPTDAEVAKMNEWRALFETTFAIATGGRGRVETTWVRPARRRAVR